MVAIRVSTYFMEAEKYRQIIITAISKATGGQNVTIDGPLTFTSTPILNVAYIGIPNITIHNAKYSDTEAILQAKTTIIQISLLDFFLSKMNVKGLEIHDAHLNLERMPNQKLNWEFLEDSNDKKYASFNLNSLTFNNSSLSIKDSNFQADYSNINAIISFDHDSIIDINGNFQLTEQTLNINASISKFSHDSTRDAQIHLSNDVLDTVLKAKIINQNASFEIMSNVQLRLNKPAFIIDRLVTIFPALESISPKDNFDNPLYISGDLLINDNLFEAANIKIDSTLTKGTAFIRTNFSENKNIEMNFNFDSIDVANFVSFDDDDLIQNLTNNAFSNNSAEDHSYINFALIDIENIALTFDAKQILMHDLAIKNIDLDFVTRSGAVNQGNLALEIQNKDRKAAFKLNNLTFRKVDNLHILVGELYSSGNNINDTLNMLGLQDYLNINDTALQYNIASKIILSSKELSIFEIDGTIGQASHFSGSVASTYDEMNHYNFDLKFNGLKLINFEMPLVKERAATLLTKSGSDDYLSYFRWFRTLSSSYRFKLEFIDSELKDEKIENLKTVCKLSPGNMSFILNLKSDFADGAYQIDLDATKLQPTLNIVVNSLNIDLNRLQPLIPGWTNNDTAPDNIQETWSDAKFNLFRIYKYATKLDLSIQNFLVADHKLDMFRFIGHTSTNILYVDNLYFKTYGGQVQAQGNLSFFDQLLGQVSFVASEIDSQDLLAAIFPSLSNVYGKFSATGSIISQGDSMKSVIANLSTSSNFAAAQMSINGVDGDSIVDLALQRKPVDKNDALALMNGFLNAGQIDVTNITGNIKAAKGILKSNDTTFKTRFSNAAFAMSLDLNNLTFSSATQFSFAPYSDKNAVSYQIMEAGSLQDPTLTKTIDKAVLTKFIKKQYGIVTEEDILEAKKRLEEEKRALAIDPDSKDYLYYKLQQLDEDKARSNDTNSSNAVNSSNNNKAVAGNNAAK